METPRNLRILRTIPVLFVVFFASFPAYAKYSGGTGQPNDPYQIATAEDLMLLGETPEDYDKHFILTADIDLDPTLPGRKVFDRAVIAPDVNDDEDSFQGTAFAGVFDGNGHTISHLTTEGGGNLGLFGQLGPGAIISNLALEAVNVNGTGNFVGGLVGRNKDGSITSSYITGSVNGNRYVGGLVGLNYGGGINTSFSMGTVTGGSDVGGLVGDNAGSITASYSMGSVNGDIQVGGLVGYSWGGIVTMTYSSGSVSGNKKVGGLVGYKNGGSITSSFWDIETSGQATSDGGTGATTPEMHSLSTYLEAGWDFVNETINGPNDIWTICELRGYPRLLWEKLYVDDDATGDPLENGRQEHPFDTIQEAIDIAPDCLTILVRPGLYSKIDYKGKAITVAGTDGAAVIEALSFGGRTGTTIGDEDAVTFHTGEGPDSVLKNFIITNSGMAISLNFSSPTITNITIVGNNFGIGAYENSNPSISNCILWNNTNGDLFECEARYSCIQEGGPGVGNISVDPLFVDAANGDYHLKSAGWRWNKQAESWSYDYVTSPCIDAGNPGSPLGDEPMNVPRDPDNEYGVNLRINMGAFGGTSQASMPPPGWALLGDLNNDGCVDYVDLAGQVQEWLMHANEQPGDLNRDGVVDSADFTALAESWLGRSGPVK